MPQQLSAAMKRSAVAGVDINGSAGASDKVESPPAVAGRTIMAQRTSSKFLRIGLAAWLAPYGVMGIVSLALLGLGVLLLALKALQILIGALV